MAWQYFSQKKISNYFFKLFIGKREDDKSVYSEDSVDTTTTTEKQYLLDFVKTWKTYPELWNTSTEAYRDKVKKMPQTCC